MGINMGGYVGFGKETTYGTPNNTPTVYAVLNGKMAHINSKVNPIDVPNTSSFGPLTAVPGLEQLDVNGEFVVTPKAVGALLAQLLGLPTTTGAGPNYSHAFQAANTQPGWTWQAKDGVTCASGAGVKLSQLQFSHDPSGLFTVQAQGMGIQKQSGVTPTTPVLETQIFYAKHLTVTLGGTPISATVEKCDLTLAFGKEALPGFGDTKMQGVESDGTANITCALSFRFDGTDRLAQFKAVTGTTLTLAWVIDANTSITFTFPDARLTDDPMNTSNDNLGIARVALNYRMYNFNSAAFVTVKNGQATY